MNIEESRDFKIKVAKFRGEMFKEHGVMVDVFGHVRGELSENWGFHREQEQKLQDMMIYFFRENMIYPSISKNGEIRIAMSNDSLYMIGDKTILCNKEPARGMFFDHKSEQIYSKYSLIEMITNEMTPDSKLSDNALEMVEYCEKMAKEVRKAFDDFNKKIENES